MKCLRIAATTQGVPRHPKGNLASLDTSHGYGGFGASFLVLRSFVSVASLLFQVPRHGLNFCSMAQH